VLAGGVGGSKFLKGLVRVVDPAKVTIIANTADDEEFFGLYVSPDLDTIVYTLSGVANPKSGWGRARDSFRCLGELGRLFGKKIYFRLGDLDLATHIYRTHMLRRGRALSEVARSIACRFGVSCRLLPMSDQPVRTFIDTPLGLLPFQRYFVELGARPRVKRVVLKGAAKARPAPGVLEAIERASLIIVAPSNPVVSITPILSVPGIRAALRRSSAPKVAISPIIGRQAISGPAAAMLEAKVGEASAYAVAWLYRDFLDAMIVDSRDVRRLAKIERLGIRAKAASVLIPTAARARKLARQALEFGLCGK